MRKIIAIVGICLICGILAGCDRGADADEPAAPTTTPAALPTTPAVLTTAPPPPITEPPTEKPTIERPWPTPTTPPPPHAAHGDLLAAYDRARAAYSRAIRGDFDCTDAFAEYLREIFAEYIVAELLAGGRYYAPVELGEQAEQIFAITDDIVIFRVINERPERHTPQWQHQMPTSTANFVAQNIEGNWIFTNFWMMEQVLWGTARTQPENIHPAASPPDDWLAAIHFQAHRRAGFNYPRSAAQGMSNPMVSPFSRMAAMPTAARGVGLIIPNLTIWRIFGHIYRGYCRPIWLTIYSQTAAHILPMAARFSQAPPTAAQIFPPEPSITSLYA